MSIMFSSLALWVKSRLDYHSFVLESRHSSSLFIADYEYCYDTTKPTSEADGG